MFFCEYLHVMKRRYHSMYKRIIISLGEVLQP